jgi:hypothetical protein
MFVMVRNLLIDSRCLGSWMPSGFSSASTVPRGRLVMDLDTALVTTSSSKEGKISHQPPSPLQAE